MSAPTSSSRINATVLGTVTGRAKNVYRAIVALDPALTLTGYGLIPAVTTTTHQGSWQTVGDTRSVTFSDGSSAREVITTLQAPHIYAYRLTELTGVLGHLVQHADSSWNFTQEGASTHCEWNFTFTAKPRRAALIRFALLPIWTAYMRKVLQNTTEAVHKSLNA
jgi:hypothetical protein